MGRGRDADDVVAVGFVRDAKRETQISVRADRRVDDTGRSLGRQHEVDPKAAATLGQVDDSIDERGQLSDERRELVDDEDQSGGGPLRVPGC